MRKTTLLVALFCTAILLGGCTMSVQPISGPLYSDVKGPMLANAGPTAEKVGTAQCQSIIGITTGDASISTAMRNGGITQIQHVDYYSKNVLGVWAQWTVMVYGQ